MEKEELIKRAEQKLKELNIEHDGEVVDCYDNFGFGAVTFSANGGADWIGVSHDTKGIRIVSCYHVNTHESRVLWTLS